MKIKTKLILGSALICLPLMTFANLHTKNFTDEDSSVKVTSGSAKPCSYDAGVFTPARSADGSPGESDVDDNKIKLLCLTSIGKCTADIFNTRDCKPQKIGDAEMDLKTKKVTRVTTTDSRYAIDVEGDSNTIVLRYTAK